MKKHAQKKAQKKQQKTDDLRCKKSNGRLAYPSKPSRCKFTVLFSLF